MRQGRTLHPQPERTGKSPYLQGWSLLFLLLFLMLTVLPVPAEETASMKFIGAARSVGGSAILLQTEKYRLLIDFGLYTDREQGERNREIPFDPATIDAVILTHAHSDHAGRIPLLYRHGFRGRIIGTSATKSLLKILWSSRPTSGNKDEGEQFRPGEVQEILKNYHALPYERLLSLTPELGIRLLDAGHILGSAMVEIRMRSGGEKTKIVLTGDMGNADIPLLRGPARITEGDFVVVEATYGAAWRTVPGQMENFAREIRETLAAGGSVLIPAFSLDRTQKVLFTLGRLRSTGLIPEATPVFADSSLGGKITLAYRRHRSYLHPDVQRSMDEGRDPFSFPGLRQVSGAEALAAHGRTGGAIYVTSSGMLDHGNAPNHLERMCGDPKNLLAIVGWQAPGSLGAQLLEGRRRIFIPLREGEGNPQNRQRSEKEVKMRVRKFDLFSNHADACQLLSWLANFTKTKRIFVVHGDGDNTQRLAALIERNLGFQAVSPMAGESFPLSGAGGGHRRKSAVAPCAGLEKTAKTEVKGED